MPGFYFMLKASHDEAAVVVLFTDFGWQGPYVGLLKLALRRYQSSIPIVDLWHDVPAFNARGAAYLLAAYAHEFPPGAVFVGVVDPGVGGARPGVILRADGRLFVGPDNGLFDRVAVHARDREFWQITWRPERLSASFHGRDLFAPVAAMLALGMATPEQLGGVVPFLPRDWPDDLARIVYLDRYGNAMTGIRSISLGSEALILIKGHTLRRARTFSDVLEGQCFWYENSSGLVELACNQDSLAAKLSLSPDDTLEIRGQTFSVIGI
jgi:S-adenosylmethionine hydrolase